MSVTSSQSPPFEQAKQMFDLDRLRADLERIGQIDPIVWDYLKGILCGLNQKEIADQCGVEEGTVKTALTRGVKSQILGLFPDKSKVDWKRLSRWLIDAGYGIGENHRVNWPQVCRKMLDQQKRLSTNEVIASEAMRFDLLDDGIFVSLALVERKEPDRLSQDVNPARSIERYQEKPPIEYETFREQVLRPGKSDRIAIVGEPGAGKTTLLQHIAFWILDQGLGLPIWISLGDLIKKNDLQRLQDYLMQVWLKDAISNITESIMSDFSEQLNNQRVWLLLDGADEIVALSGIELREINQQLRGWLNQSCIILTCRINVWDADSNALREFKTYRTNEFHYPTEVERFIELGFRKSNQPSGEHLKTELAQTKRTRLQQLVRNPLRLMMLCTTWHEQESLPSTKAELYMRFVSEFYRWDKVKSKKKDLNYELFPNTVVKQEKLNKALARLSRRALEEESSPFRLPHSLVFEELGDPDEDGSNFWLAIKLGWLQVARNSEKPSEKVYIFFHPTFQEYFSALAIDNWQFFFNHNSQNPSEGNYRVFEPLWKESFLFWLGRLDMDLDHHKESLIRSLRNFNDGCNNFYTYQAFFLIGESLSEFKNSHAEDIVGKLLNLACDRKLDSRFLWIKATEIVCKSGKNLVARKVIEFIEENHYSDIRSYALDILEKVDPHNPEIKMILESDLQLNWTYNSMPGRSERWSLIAELLQKDDELRHEEKNRKKEDVRLKLEAYSPTTQGEADQLIIGILNLIVRLESSKDKTRLQDLLSVFDAFLKDTEGFSSINRSALTSMVVALRGMKDSSFWGDYSIWLWQCAQNMSYPDFYQAWHNPLPFTDSESLTEWMNNLPDDLQKKILKFVVTLRQ
jgi:SpoVK/Ycf46/Vps4 family AAA+-type ATPase